MEKNVIKNKNAKKVVIFESPVKAKKLSEFFPEYSFVATGGHIRDLPKNEMGIQVYTKILLKTKIRRKEGTTENIELNKKRLAMVEDLKDDDICVFYDLRTTESKEELVSKIKKLCQNKEVIIATDADREGEVIASHIADELDGITNSCERIRVNAITEETFKREVANLTEIDDKKAKAGIARRLLDRLIGFTLSGPASLALGLNIGENSVGRTQSACLAMLVDKEKEINDFKSETFYQMKFESVGGLTFISDKKTDISLFPKNTNNELKIKNIKKEREYEAPPETLTNSVLLSKCSERKIPTSVAEQILQNLYEKGLITYPRTDSQRIAPENKTKIQSFMKQNEILSKVIDYNSQHGTLIKQENAKEKVQNAHECIQPTDALLTPSLVQLSEEEKAVYDIIWRITIASQCKPTIWVKTNIFAETKQGTILSLCSKGIEFKGWRNVASNLFPVSADVKMIKDIDKYKVGELLVGELQMTKEKTLAPARYNESTLLQNLQQFGIGRPSTYSTIINSQFSKGHAEISEDIIKPTNFGIRQIELLQKICPEIINSDYTSKMEEMLDKVELGEELWHIPVKEVYSLIDKAVSKLNSTGRDMRLEKEEIDRIRAYQRQMGVRERKGKFTKYPSYTKTTENGQFI